MSLNVPVTKKFEIGPQELRVSPLASAGIQTQGFSVGAIDSTSIEQTINSVDMQAGFPQQPVDTAITSYSYQLTAVLKEQSRRNLNILFGNGVNAYDTTDVHGVVDTASAIADGATSITMVTGFTGSLAHGDTVTIYEVANPSNVNVCVVDTFSSGAITLLATTPIKGPDGATHAFNAGAAVNLYKNLVVAGGAISGPVYFAVRLVSLDRGTGRPKVYDLWKATLAGSSTLTRNVTEWSTPNLVLKLLKPTLADYATGGPLANMAARISTGSVDNTFAIADVSDAA